MSDDLTDLLRTSDVLSPDERATREARSAFVGAGLSRSQQRRVLRPALAFVAVLAALAAAFGAGLAVASRSEGTTETAVDAPGFLPANGWHTLQNGVLLPPSGVSAMASTRPFDPTDLRNGGRPARTIATLGPEDVLIYSMFFTAGQVPSMDSTFPHRDLPLRLSFAVDGGLEGIQAPKVERLRVGANGYDIDALIIYGSANPPARVVAEADGELERLAVPGCPSASDALSSADRSSAADFAAQWVRDHYLGRKADIANVSATGYVIGNDSPPDEKLARAVCGESADRIAEVVIDVPPAARAQIGRLPLRYFVYRSDGEWRIWRQV